MVAPPTPRLVDLEIENKVEHQKHIYMALRDEMRIGV